MKTVTQTPALSLAMHLNLAKTSVQKHLDKTLSTHGIGVSEFWLMTILSDNGTMSRVALADRLSMSASAITKLLTPMEKTGLIVKIASDKDARQSLVALSETGRQVYTDALPTAQAELSYHFARLSDKEIGQLIGLLAKI